MTPPADPARYKNHRFPGEIISHGVWLSYRFPLSYRDVQEADSIGFSGKMTSL
jgi:transposase-like protein